MMPARHRSCANQGFRDRDPAFRLDACEAQLQAIQAGKISFHGLTHGHYPGLPLPRAALPGLRSIGFWDAVGIQDWGMDLHRNDGLEISLLETGSMDFIAEDQISHLAPGTLTVTRPWQLHRHGVPHVGPGRFKWFILEIGALMPKESWQWPGWIDLFPEDLQDLSSRLRESQDCVWRASPEIIMAFRRLTDYLARPKPAAHLSAIRLHINHILLGLLETLRAGKTSGTPRTMRSLEAVSEFLRQLNSDANLLGEKWTLETMAKRCGIGVSALNANCHTLTNTTPMDYLNLRRLSWAAEQLKQAPQKPVTQIALEAGFSSSAYFATRFRERFGKSAHIYRQASVQETKKCW